MHVLACFDHLCFDHEVSSSLWFYSSTVVRLLLREWAGLLLSNLVAPYETTRITGAATVYMGFVPCGGFFQLPTQYDTTLFVASFMIPLSIVSPSVGIIPCLAVVTSSSITL